MIKLWVTVFAQYLPKRVSFIMKAKIRTLQGNNNLADTLFFLLRQDLAKFSRLVSVSLLLSLPSCRDYKHVPPLRG